MRARGPERAVIQSNCPPNPQWGHHGTYAYDFEMPIGTPVIASRGGTVFAVRETSADGDPRETNHVFVEHADGTLMSYIHLTRDGALVEVGEAVSRGQVIGRSGNTGPSSGPHLHVSLFRNRSGFDGRNTLPLTYRNAEGPVDGRGGLVHGAIYTALP